MKLSTKPISSPGRPDKFPPPLMRFLRSNTGSRSSRGSKSRSSPMFLRKKNTNTAIETTQEPSSPKVTCMGQVRVRRSSKQAATAATGDRAPTKCRCRCRCLWWVPNAVFCYHFAAKIKPCHCQPVWPNWGFFRVGSFRRKSTKFREESTKAGSNFRGSSSDEDDEEKFESEERVEANAFVSNSCTPPTNALLLTRCRSAPYRSSSLACRFWGSPLRNDETGEEQSVELENVELSTENGKPTSQTESISDQEETEDPKMELKLRFFKELEDSLRERIMESENVRELKRREGVGGDPPPPLVLTRCKSEPARTAQKLDPEVNNFWKKRGLDFADTWSLHDL